VYFLTAPYQLTMTYAYWKQGRHEVSPSLCLLCVYCLSTVYLLYIFVVPCIPNAISLVVDGDDAGVKGSKTHLSRLARSPPTNP
jgi:hypothetical protein